MGGEISEVDNLAELVATLGVVKDFLVRITRVMSVERETEDEGWCVWQEFGDVKFRVIFREVDRNGGPA